MGHGRRVLGIALCTGRGRRPARGIRPGAAPGPRRPAGRNCSRSPSCAVPVSGDVDALSGLFVATSVRVERGHEPSPQTLPAARWAVSECARNPVGGLGTRSDRTWTARPAHPVSGIIEARGQIVHGSRIDPPDLAVGVPLPQMPRQRLDLILGLIRRAHEEHPSRLIPRSRHKSTHVPRPGREPAQPSGLGGGVGP